MKLSEYVRNMRIKKDFTLSALARKLEVSPMFISKIENDKTVPQSGETLEKMANLFGISYDELQMIAAKSKELLRIENAKNEDISSFRLSLARAMVESDISEKQLEEIEKIIKNTGNTKVSITVSS